MTMSAESSVVPVSSVSPSQSPEFERTAMAILVAMVLLIVALTGILVETTWGHSTAGDVEVVAPEPGSVARR
jgi:hypothetical protein